jgi:tetratricopeptide (TPR) repeat protein
VLALQDEIAASVAAQLRATLAGEIDAARSIDPQAYEHKLRGAYLFSRRREGDLEAALQHFEAALALEPNYGEAWVGLAGVRWVLMLDDDRMEPEELKAFREAALRGVELSPDMPEAHLRAAASYAVIGAAAMRERHMRIAMELDPENPLLLGMLAGRAVRAGDLEEALDYQYRALRQDPLHLVTRGNLVSFLLASGRIEQARLEFNTIVELGGERAAQESHLLLLEGRYAEAWEILRQPADDADWLARGAMALHGLGRETEALAWIEPLRSEETYHAAFALAEFEAWRGEVDAGLEWLEQARERLALLEPVPSIPSWQLLLTLSPYLAPLRADPRYEEIAKIAP